MEPGVIVPCNVGASGRNSGTRPILPAPACEEFSTSRV
jgi:hypothetical protein